MRQNDYLQGGLPLEAWEEERQTPRTFTKAQARGANRPPGYHGKAARRTKSSRAPATASDEIMDSGDNKLLPIPKPTDDAPKSWTREAWRLFGLGKLESAEAAATHALALLTAGPPPDGNDPRKPYAQAALGLLQRIQRRMKPCKR